MLAINSHEAFLKIEALKAKLPQGRMTKKLQAELSIREKVLNEVQEALKNEVHIRSVIPLFRQEVKTEFPKRQLIRCEAGYIYDDKGTIAYETYGAQDTFAIGMPMYDQQGKFLGRLTIDFLTHLNYHVEDENGKTVEIPSETWRIAGYKPDPNRKETIHPLTYYQLKARTNRDGHLMNYIKVNDYRHVEEITFGEKTYKSCYNHNYYYSGKQQDLILEECDDDTCCSYDRIDKDGNQTYLGMTLAGGFGIFDNGFADEVKGYFPADGIAELDPDEC